MTIPMPYQRAKQDFDAFLADAAEVLDFPTRNPTYTTVQGVFLAFRRRLGCAEILAFANVLPPLLRAMFVAEWDATEPHPFASRAELEAEVRGLRRHHNLTPESSIAKVAGVLRRHVDEKRFDAVLAQMPEGAAEFWAAQ